MQIPLTLRAIPLSQGGLQALPPLSKGGAATAAVGFKKLKFYKEITDLTSFCHCERSEAISSCTFKLKPYSALSLVPSRDSGSRVQSCFFSVTSGLFSDPLCKSCNFVPSLYSLYSC